MPTERAADSAVQLAVLDYFSGERAEMAIAIAIILVVGVICLWLYISSRTDFALALLVTIALFGGVMAAGLASLMIRDHRSSHALSQTLRTDQHSGATQSEKARLGIVISKFKYYRYGATVLGLLAIIGLMFSARAWAHGIAAGLLLVVVAQVVIDHFSERRAQIYMQKLNAV